MIIVPSCNHAYGDGARRPTIEMALMDLSGPIRDYAGVP